MTDTILKTSIKQQKSIHNSPIMLPKHKNHQFDHSYGHGLAGQPTVLAVDEVREVLEEPVEVIGLWLREEEEEVEEVQEVLEVLEEEEEEGQLAPPPRHPHQAVAAVASPGP